MTTKRILIMVKVDPPAVKEKEWNNWYNTIHIPARLEIPGFFSARRFTAIEGIPKGFATRGDPEYLTLYDLANTGVITSGPYLKLRARETALSPDSFEMITERLPKFARGVYKQIYPEQEEYKPPATRFVLVVGHEVPRNRQQEFNAWYNTEHIPSVLGVPGFVTARRFIHADNEIPPMFANGGSLPKYLTVYDVESRQAIESKAFHVASESPWSTWVRSWYRRKMCVFYQRIFPER